VSHPRNLIRHLLFAGTEIQVQIEPDFQTESEIDWINEREKMRGKKREKRKKPAKAAARAKRGRDEQVKGGKRLLGWREIA